MKKIKYLLTSFIFFIVGFTNCFAAPSSSIGVSRNQIEVGQTVTATITIKNVAAWNIKINGTGNTNSCSTSAADATSNGKNATRSFSLTCKANSVGVIRISYSGDATSEDGSTSSLSGSKTITVVAARPKSNNNNLKSLSVDGSTISPEFDADVLEYTSVFEPGTTKISINAEKADGYASISGVGEKDVVEGDNKFEVVVTSETGVSKTYVITVTVKEFAPIIVKVDGKELSLVRKADSLVKPESFEETTVQIGEDTIPAFYSEKLDITLVGLKDSDGNVSLYKYNDGKYTRYIELSSKTTIINIIDMDMSKLPDGYEKYLVKYAGFEFSAYKIDKDSNFALVYATNTLTGKKDLYQIDLKNETVQLFNNDYEKLLTKYNKLGYIILGVLGGVILLQFFMILILKGKNKRIIGKIKKEKFDKVKKAAIKESKKESVDKKDLKTGEIELKDEEVIVDKTKKSKKKKVN